MAERENYVALDAWLRARGLSNQERYRLHVARVREADKLCERCSILPQHEMLCSGVRYWFDEEESTSLGVMRIGLRTCGKRQRINEQEALRRRLVATLLPQTRVRTWVDNKAERVLVPVERCEDNVLIVDGIKLPTFTRTDADARGMLAVWQYMVAMAYHGVQARYIEPEFFLNHYSKPLDEISTLLVDSTDWLVVDRVDLCARQDYRHNYIVRAVEHRMLRGLPTYVTLNAVPDGEHRQFFEELIEWPNMPLT